MIESVLYFVLGFLSAAFLVALVAPSAWRRAAMLTARRIEASVPLTLDEIRADRDGLRAQHAVTARRLEEELKQLRTQSVESSAAITRERQGIQAIVDERDRLIAEGNASKSETQELRDDIARREEAQSALASALDRTEAQLENQAAELKKLEEAFENASYAASTRQIDLVARDGTIEKLQGDLAAYKKERSEMARIRRELDAEVGSRNFGADSDRQRAEVLDGRIARLVAELSDRDDKLERREMELTRLREKLNAAPVASSANDNGAMRLAELRADNLRLEGKVAELTAQLAEAAQAGGGSSDEPAASRALREQMQQLAAEVVHMVALVEGEGSPIDRALNGAGENEPATNGETSLAGRILALRRSPLR